MSNVVKRVLAMAAGCVAFCSAPALAQAACDRPTLQDIADRYVKAQADGSMFALPVGEWVDYRENLVMSSSATGVLGTPREFAWTSKLLDPAQCKVFVEGVILAPEPYVLATVVNNGFFGVNQISTVIGSGDAEHCGKRKLLHGFLLMSSQQSRGCLWRAPPGCDRGTSSRAIPA